MSTISIRKAEVENKKGVVILPIKEYKKLLARAVPTYYLTGKEAEKVDRLVREGLEEYHQGKTIAAGSLKSALRKYNNRKSAR